MGPYSFRVTIGAPDTTGAVPAPQVAELTGDIPPGVYQVSGSEGSGADTHAHTVSVVRHDADGTPVIGASGYGQ